MSRELRVNRFTTTAQGLVPAPLTATGLFLRDDATWAAAGGSSGGGNVTPDTHPASPNALDDEFESATLDPKWLWLNQGAGSYVLSQGSLILTSEFTTASIDKQALVQVFSGGTAFKLRMKTSLTLANSTNNGGLILYESATGKNIVMGFYYGGAGAGITFYGAAYPAISGGTGTSLFSTSPFSQVYVANSLGYTYIEMELVSGVLRFRASLSGVNGTFLEYGNTTIASWFTTAPNRAGVFVESQSTVTPAILVPDWFRRIS